ncbi:DUF2865 domain-containing protein [Stappia taiwanensis]|uniref:DUF2865 domain-containing protein n=1 Tax=Stappia taiwanensis TaxID=992267 RepID=A0A838XT06_9HYPH|nr:DUF2865 domain-containing protein [Stappia taiwanensis]MBA4611676.1 DUF2865 domain-containing protein [Stappia taiwanensis]GGE97648.1 hypothetical protein GCM10007285_26620 [Stappia taiwanensis]
MRNAKRQRAVAPVARALLAGVLLTAALLITGTQGASAATCQALAAELNRAAARTPQSAEQRKWARAARQQAKSLSLAERDARHLGCNAGGGDASCAALTAKIKKMRANLAKLERKRDRLTRGGGGAKARTAQLRRAMKSQGCGTTRSARSSERGGGFLALFGIGRDTDRANDRDRGSAVRTTSTTRTPDRRRSSVRVTSSSTRRAPRRAMGQTYRTMCVRTCDGFFFPVSYAVTENGLSRDAAVCRSMCPSAETRLFLHRNPGETLNDLVALDGTPYEMLPNANRFRTQFVAGCSCQSENSERQTMARLITSGDDATAAGYLRDSIAGKAEPKVPQPSVPRGADPDTALNLRLGFAPARAPTRLPVLGRPQAETAPTPTEAKPQEEPATPAMTKPAEEGKRPVRVVGPRYYVAQ